MRQKPAMVVLMVSGILLSLAFSAHAAAPRSDTEIPVYPGVSRDTAAEAEAAGMADPDEGGATATRIYTTAAPAEEVLRFYLKELGGTEGDIADYPDSGATPPGAVSPVYHQVYFFDFSVYEPADAQRTRVELEKTRTPFAPGQWVSAADFAWEAGAADGGIARFDLHIEDESFHTFDADGNRKMRTRIVVDQLTLTPDDMREEADGDVPAEWETDDGADAGGMATGAAFDPADAGIPVYPGARYDAETTRLLKENMGVNGAAYRTDADAGTVVAFYRKQAGLNPVHADEKGGLFRRCREEYNEYLKRTMATGECDVDVTVQNPWMDMSSGKMMTGTLISIVNTGN